MRTVEVLIYNEFKPMLFETNVEVLRVSAGCLPLTTLCIVHPVIEFLFLVGP